MGRISANKPPTSCASCFAWGVLPGRSCRACYTFARLHDPGDCAACGRVVPVKKGYCRLCWQQASLDAKDHVTVLQPFLERVTHQQLFFTGMHRIRQPGPLLGNRASAGLAHNHRSTTPEGRRPVRRSSGSRSTSAATTPNTTGTSTPTHPTRR